MEGLWRTDPTSLRPAADAPAPLPRAVLRHLVAAGSLGVGSRVLVGGDGAVALAAFLNRLGMDAEVADAGPVSDRYDAVIRLHPGSAPDGRRSLLAPAVLERTAGLIAAVRPLGAFLLVARVGDPTGGHRSTCLERHFATFPGQARLTVFPDRSVFRLLGGRRSGYAVAAWQAPGTAVDPAAWRRRAVAEARSAACCHWAEAPSLPRRVA